MVESKIQTVSNILTYVLLCLSLFGSQAHGSITNVNFHCAENGPYHKTNRFDVMRSCESLVVRRGQQFTIDQTLSEPFNPNYDAVQVYFAFTDFFGKNQINSKDWQIKTSFFSGGRLLRIEATPSADAAIGKWNLFTKIGRRNAEVVYKTSASIYVLFNAWSKEDSVYTETEQDRQEYVLQDSGYIINSQQYSSRSSLPWRFGQFEQDILDITLSILQAAKVPIKQLGSSLVVSKYLAHGIGAYVLLGRWDFENKPFHDGVYPTMWRQNSPEILRLWYRQQRPVRYGQCWIFAALLQACSRALGIPTRILTNFNTVVDENDNLMWDLHIRGGQVIKQERVWGYHVWNEVLIRRFNTNYHWQSVDATPQTSNNVFSTHGPASVALIKYSNLNEQYDSRFLFAAVNAPRMNWVYDEYRRTYQPSSKEAGRYPQQIVTMTTRGQVLDLTRTYAVEDNSGYRRGKREVDFDMENSTANEIENVQFRILCSNATVGSPFSISVLIENYDTNHTRHIDLNLSLKTTTQDGNETSTLKKLYKEIQIDPMATSTIVLNFTWADYADKNLDEALIKTTLVANEKNTLNYFHHDQYDELVKPNVETYLYNEAAVGKSLRGIAKFKNPLPIALSNGTFSVQGPGVEGNLEFHLSKKVPVGGEVTYPFTMIPLYEENTMVITNFYSDELPSNFGSAIVNVKS